jgi:hypothetical protein
LEEFGFGFLLHQKKEKENSNRPYSPNFNSLHLCNVNWKLHGNPLVTSKFIRGGGTHKHTHVRVSAINLSYGNKQGKWKTK